MKKKKKIVCFTAVFWFLLFGECVGLFPQNGLQMSVSGYVRDVNSNMPIAGIEVLIFKLDQDSITKSYYGTSNINGFYKIKFLDSGEYEFVINNPTIGIIHIESIAQGGKIKDPYSFRIMEGTNINLNIFMGENDFPSVRSVVSEFTDEINFTMLYMKRKEEKIAMRTDTKDSTSPVIYKECGGFTWVFKTDSTEVSDDYLIGGPEANEDGVVFGSFHMQYLLYPPTINCNDKKCEFLNYRLEVDSCISIHSVNYFMEQYKVIEECALCFRQCTLNHEIAHADTYFPIACEEWTKFRNKLDSIPCCKYDDCKEKFFKYYFEFKNKITTEMEKTHEELEISDKECHNRCPNGCN